MMAFHRAGDTSLLSVGSLGRLSVRPFSASSLLTRVFPYSCVTEQGQDAQVEGEEGHHQETNSLVSLRAVDKIKM